jgi:hypothetical protein
MTQHNTAQHYTGTKQLKAMPMTRLDYNVYRGWSLPADENGADDGYLVEYTDGGAPNHPAHTGYVSWSPKAQFEAAYLPMGHVDHLAPHQQRVVGEKVELDDKLTKLRAFLEGKAKELVPAAEYQRMKLQADAMGVYSDVLAQRIAAFTEVA